MAQRQRLVERGPGIPVAAARPRCRPSGPTAATAGATGSGRRGRPDRPTTRWRTPGGAGSGRTTTPRRPTRAAARARACEPGRRWCCQSRSLMSHASRNPSAVTGRNFGFSGYRRSSSASTSGATSTPLITRFLISPLIVVSEISTPRMVTRCRSEWLMRRAVEQHRLEPRPLHVRPLERRPREVLEAFGHGVQARGCTGRIGVRRMCRFGLPSSVGVSASTVTVATSANVERYPVDRVSSPGHPVTRSVNQDDFSPTRRRNSSPVVCDRAGRARRASCRAPGRPTRRCRRGCRRRWR